MHFYRKHYWKNSNDYIIIKTLNKRYKLLKKNMERKKYKIDTRNYIPSNIKYREYIVFCIESVPVHRAAIRELCFF